MPSPIGHALGGIAFSWLAVPRRNWNAAAAVALLALAPDLDLLVGDHRGISHSLGAAVVAGAAAWSAFALTPLPPSPRLRRTRRRDRLRWAIAVSLAWGSHILLDWLSNDTRPPIGVMALWPATRDYYKAAIEIFPPVSRRFGDARFWTDNLTAAIVELLILGPVTLLVVRWLRKKPEAGSWKPEGDS
jgi:membrane-bound metal-dependent hydrolase YbcI (DUF457 family)